MRTLVVFLILGGTALAQALCPPLDNGICYGSVDGANNPNFLTTAAGVALPINGGTTPLVLVIAGRPQHLNTNVTLTVPSTTNVQQWILALQDTANASMVSGDFQAMNTAPFYGPTAPTCPSPSPALSATNPSFWFNSLANESELCTSNGGAYAVSNAVVIGTVFVDATPKVANVLCEPFRLAPRKRLNLFGTGADGVLTITSGTTTIDTHKQYQSVLITGGTLTHTLLAPGTATSTNGVSFQSQNPVMVLGGTITANGLGRTATAAVGTGVGAIGGVGGRGGAGGGGGGSGAISSAGGAGGGRLSWANSSVGLVGGTAGAATPTAGGNGAAAQAEPPSFFNLLSGIGGSGGNGAGDGTNNGGPGGNGGGQIFAKMPSLFVASGISIVANGLTPTAPAAGNSGGGGGGGGGMIDLVYYFAITMGSTITASSGSGASGHGTGAAGGNGGNGFVQQNVLY